MSAKGKVALFVIVFCLIAILPFAANATSASAQSNDGPDISLDTPTINAMSDKQCIEDTDWMASNHMKLLDQWRTDVVRDGNTQYVSSSGKVYEKSLDDTCLSCHSNKEEFCDSCHEYEQVDPYCWDCHDPEAGTVGSSTGK